MFAAQKNIIFVYINKFKSSCKSKMIQKITLIVHSIKKLYIYLYIYNSYSQLYKYLYL